MKHLYKLTLILFLIALCTSCDKDFEEINQNPFFPTQTDIGPLFNNVISSLRLGWNEQFYLHNETLYGITQQAALTSASFQNVSIGTEDVWSNYYTALAHIREIERRLSEMESETEQEALNNVRAQLKIILAYKTFKVTDLFGDIPFFDAGRGFEDLQFARPKFDRQEDIYLFLLDELKWASENINTEPNPQTTSGIDYISFGAFDTFLDGDIFRWQRFSNSLRLRHALRMYEVEPTIAGEIIAEILNNSLPLISNGEDILMKPSAQNWLRESAHWSFREHNRLRMGSTIWNEMSLTDDINGSGIYDPRAYIFFEGNNNDEWAVFPQNPPAGTEPSGGIPYGGQRDSNHGIKGLANIYASFNYYLIRDENDVPEIIMTSAEMNFAKAEIYLRGMGVGINESIAEGEYANGVVSSLTFWQNLKNGSSIWEVASADLTVGEMFAYSNLPQVSIFSSTNKLELVYKQKWLDAFRQPWEAFALQRRTQMTPYDGSPSNFFRFSYPPSEAENNPDNYGAQMALMGSDNFDVKFWWLN